jgi:hypothetical protein
MAKSYVYVNAFEKYDYNATRHERRKARYNRKFASKHCCKVCKNYCSRSYKEKRSRKNSAKYRNRKIDRDLKGWYMYI